MWTHFTDYYSQLEAMLRSGEEGGVPTKVYYRFGGMVESSEEGWSTQGMEMHWWVFGSESGFWAVQRVAREGTVAQRRNLSGSCDNNCSSVFLAYPLVQPIYADESIMNLYSDGILLCLIYTNQTYQYQARITISIRHLAETFTAIWYILTPKCLLALFLNTIQVLKTFIKVPINPVSHQNPF